MNKHLGHLLPEKEFNMNLFREDNMKDKLAVVKDPYEGAKIDENSTVSMAEYEGLLQAYQDKCDEVEKLRAYIATIQSINTRRKQKTRKVD